MIQNHRPTKRLTKEVRAPWYFSTFTDSRTGILAYTLDRRPSPEFAFEFGKMKLVNVYTDIVHGTAPALLTPADLEENDQHGQLAGSNLSGRLGTLSRLGGRIDLDNQVSVGCAGAVITYLHRRRAISSLPHDATDTSMFRISAIEMFHSGDIM